MAKQDQKSTDNSIGLNKKAFHDYFVEDKYETGISLQGWEVKSLRAGKLQLRDAYVIIKDGELFLIGALISPLPTASTHYFPDPTRTRKLLMHRLEIDKIVHKVERKGYTIVPISMYWKNGKVKVQIGVARGKQEHDKRATEKDRDWDREKQRIFRRAR
jgi:SsrA-binding protein